MPKRLSYNCVAAQDMKHAHFYHSRQQCDEIWPVALPARGKNRTCNPSLTGKIRGHWPHIRLKKNMVCAPQLSKRQAAPKLSTKNKPNRQKYEATGHTKPTKQGQWKSLKGWRSIKYKLKVNHRSTSSKTECSGRHYTAYIMRQKVYNYYLVRFRVELLSQKILEKNLTAAEIWAKTPLLSFASKYKRLYNLQGFHNWRKFPSKWPSL